MGGEVKIKMKDEDYNEIWERVYGKIPEQNKTIRHQYYVQLGFVLLCIIAGLIVGYAK